MIYKEPPEIGELRTCWITRTADTYTCYASSYKPIITSTGKAAHCEEAIAEGVGSGFTGRWNPWNPEYTWGLGLGVGEQRQTLPYIQFMEPDSSIKTQAVYLGNLRWRIL